MTTNEAFQQQNRTSNINISIGERWLSLIGGGALAALALRQRGALGVVLGLLSWYFTNRGLSGHDTVYDQLGINTAVKTNPRAVSVPHQQGVHVVKSVVVNRSPEELYMFWRNFENLPRIMNHLETVRVLDEQRSHWVAKGPVGTSVEWDAEIVNDVPFQVIGWRSLMDADVANSGSVRFNDIGGATELTVTLEYVPPAGKLGQAIAKLLGEEPEIQIEEDLRRFKQMAETGQTVSGWQGLDDSTTMDQGGGAPMSSSEDDNDMDSDNSGTNGKRRKKTSQADTTPADQAEGERGGEESSKVSKTPGQAEG
jgi:uncharacterized membrane protein